MPQTRSRCEDVFDPGAVLTPVRTPGPLVATLAAAHPARENIHLSHDDTSFAGAATDHSVLVFRLHRDDPFRATIAVRPGMSREELQDCLAFEFAGRHQIHSVKGVYSAGSVAGCLLPLGVVAADPGCAQSVSVTLLY